MRLTKNFTSDEHLVSEEYPWMLDGVILSEPELENCFLIDSFGLQPVRDEFGATIITSGKRTQELNTQLGGSKSSQHLTAEAVDFYCPEADSMLEVYHFLNKWPGQLFFYPKKGHIHIGLPKISIVPLKVIYDK